MKKKTAWVGATSSYHCVAEDSRIPKMPVINPLQALVHPQTQKNYPAWIVNPQPQLLRFRLFWWIDLQIRNCDFNLPSNWWDGLLQTPEFAVLVLGFEKLGLELDNCGGPPAWPGGTARGLLRRRSRVRAPEPAALSYPPTSNFPSTYACVIE
jgi:hypothetical protein